MDAFLLLPAVSRRLYCDQAQARINLPAASIEKDFWVCWTLRELFALPEWGVSLTFKGGTSLSKGWKLIDRFSEDIDIVIARDFLGFGGDDDPLNASSRKQVRKGLESLKSVCQERIQAGIYPALLEQFKCKLQDTASWSLELDPDDPEGQTILFRYPTAFAAANAYLRPVVRIELGARSDTEPSETPEIQPYLSEAFPDVFKDCRFSVRAVAPERTFWEKAMLLHEENFRPPDKPRKARLARHYYDLWSLITKGVADKAMADEGLFQRVAAHRAIFFRQNWVDYETLRPGSLRILPSEDQLAAWRGDYQSMRQVMFFGDPPRFDQILSVVGDFEQRFNQAEYD